jgi:outer membrane lipoprotein SlyB
MKRLAVAALVVLTMAGCATRGANYQPLIDTKGRDQAQLAQDTSECQVFAKQRMDAASGAVAGAVLGAVIGALLMPHGFRNQGAGYGALFGGASGAGSANDTQETIVKRCLAGRGYSVLN